MASPPSPLIRVGIGGWQFAPWRGTFYPPGLPQKQELSYTSRVLRTLEINSTYYRVPARSSFEAWRAATPEGFVFSLKAPRQITQQRRLADTAEAVAHFLGSGLASLGDRLGPVVWQLPPFKRFDANDFDTFLARLPREVEGLSLQHVLEVRHESFLDPGFLAMVRRHGIGVVNTDSDTHPSFFDTSGPLVYLRLMRARSDVPTGYPDDELERWHQRAATWAQGDEPQEDGLPRIDVSTPFGRPRPVHVLFINGAKEHAPMAAKALTARLG